MQTAPVSVIIPCYRQAEYLRACVASVLSQRVRPKEIIVASGCDESRWVARQLEADIRNVDGGDCGLSHARNLAIAAANSEYILPLDADDELHPSFLERMFAAVPRDPLFIVSAGLQEFGAREGHWDLPPYSATALLDSNGLCVASLYPKELWRLAGGYDVSLFAMEDWSFWISCSRFAPTVRVLDERLLRYRIHGSNMSAALAQYDYVFRAMMRSRHPQLYGEIRRRDDLAIIGAMPDAVLQMLDRRVLQFPRNPSLRFFRGVVRGYRGDLGGALADFVDTVAVP